MTIQCLISFENNAEGVYYAGQELSGSVDLAVSTTKKIIAIHITVCGFARVKWLRKGYNTSQNTERSVCRAYRSYLASRSYVLGSENSPCNDLLAGEYTYSFHVVLPNNIPTSFDGKYGEIKYEIVAAIERPGRYTKNFRLPFSVLQLLDLNSDPIYQVPLELISQERYWSFCRPTGPLSVKFTTSQNGYAPGQKINYHLFVDNESAIDFSESVVRFCQLVTYECRDPQHEFRYDKHQILSKSFGIVLRWSRKVFHGNFHLPSIPPTCIIEDCPIKIEYYIKINFKPRNLHKNFKMKLPVTIGTIPIILDSSPTMIRSSQTAESYLRQPSLPMIVLPSERDSDSPPEYVPMNLPSYHEALALSQKFVDDSEKFVDDSESFTEINETMFVPRYPVYSSQDDDNSDT